MLTVAVLLMISGGLFSIVPQVRR